MDGIRATAELVENRFVTSFTVASNAFFGGGKEKAEYQCNDQVSPSVSGGFPILLRISAPPGIHRRMYRMP